MSSRPTQFEKMVRKYEELQSPSYYKGGNNKPRVSMPRIISA